MADKKEKETQERAAQNQKAERVDQCVQLLIQGYTPALICKLVRENRKKPEDKRNKAYDWKVSDSQVYRYCKEANEKIDEIQAPKRKNQFNRQLQRYELLFRKALNSGDLRNARQILKEIDRLTGLDWTAGSDGESSKGEETIFVLPGGMKIAV